MRILILFAFGLAAGLPAESFKAVGMPPGTRIAGSYVCEDGKGFDKMIDGSEDTRAVGIGGSAASGQPLIITLRFARPLRGIKGLRTGASDRFHNYYPQEMEIHGDATGDGTADTLLLRTTKLGPARENIHDQIFEVAPRSLHGLELRIVRYTQQELKRAPTMAELWLLGSR